MQLNPKVCNVPIPLAITLINFSGYVNAQNNAVLQWQTAKPEPGARFDVLYATDGKHFSNAGAVNADDINTQFGFTHPYKISGKAYYKLLTTEKDGTQRQSNVIVLQGGSKLTANSITTAPMPFTSYINVNYTTANSSLVTFTIMDMNGRTLIIRQTGLNAGVNSVNIAGLEMLPSGIYLLQAVDAQGEKHTIKIQK